jgi:hypothetical protein
MEPKSSLTCSQEPTTGSYSGPAEPIPHSNQPTNQPTNKQTNKQTK